MSLSNPNYFPKGPPSHTRNINLVIEFSTLDLLFYIYFIYLLFCIYDMCMYYMCEFRSMCYNTHVEVTGQLLRGQLSPWGLEQQHRQQSSNIKALANIRAMGLWLAGVWQPLNTSGKTQVFFKPGSPAG